MSKEERKEKDREREKARRIDFFSLSNERVKYSQTVKDGIKCKIIDIRHSLTFYSCKNTGFVSQLISYCCYVLCYVCGEQQLHIRIVIQVCYDFSNY